MNIKPHPHVVNSVFKYHAPPGGGTPGPPPRPLYIIGPCGPYYIGGREAKLRKWGLWGFSRIADFSLQIRFDFCIFAKTYTHPLVFLNRG